MPHERVKVDLPKPGQYVAKIISYGIAEPKDATKKPEVRLTFEFDENGTNRQVNYKGFLTDAAAEYTIKNLITCGMKSDKLSSLTQPGAFENKEISITVEHEEYNGKTYARVKWINDLGGSKFKALTPEIAERSLDHFSAYVKGMRAEMGAPAPKPESDYTI